MESLAIFFTGPQTVELRRVRVPDPGRGEVLVRTTKTLISTGTECIAYAHLIEPGTNWERMVQYPWAAGYSHAGVVEAVGEGVADLRPGDRVASFHRHSQYAWGPAESFLPVPEGVTDEEGTFYALTTVVQNAIRKAEHELGDTVVVVGLGILGQLVVQYARLMGAREVIAVDLSEGRLAMAAEHGATATLCMGADAAREPLADLTGGRLADVVYDVTGNPEVFAPAQRLARRFGRLVLLGDTGTPSQQRLVNDFLWRGLRIIGAFSGDPPPDETDHHFWTRKNMARLFFDYVRRGQMRVSDLITHRFRPQEAAEVYKMLLHDRGATVGVVFDWEQV
ncbi:zinc-binding dehydrogenase [bacterium]|nr:zinc-binding dehydrogenase [bacterium]